MSILIRKKDNKKITSHQVFFQKNKNQKAKIEQKRKVLLS